MCRVHAGLRVVAMEKHGESMKPRIRMSYGYWTCSSQYQEYGGIGRSAVEAFRNWKMFYDRSAASVNPIKVMREFWSRIL